MQQSMKDVSNTRVFEAVSVLGLDFGIGTLWWADEDVWKSKISRKYDSNSKRSGHPALSLRRQPLKSPYEMVPMLHGTSLKKKKVAKRFFAVSGISDDDRITVFGGVGPVAMELGLFSRSIHRNRHKPKLSPQEQESLVQWMKKRGF